MKATCFAFLFAFLHLSLQQDSGEIRKSSTFLEDFKEETAENLVNIRSNLEAADDNLKLLRVQFEMNQLYFGNQTNQDYSCNRQNQCMICWETSNQYFSFSSITCRLLDSNLVLKVNETTLAEEYNTDQQISDVSVNTANDQFFIT